MAFVNLLDTSVSLVSTTTPGRDVDLRRWKTRARTGVPVKLWVFVLEATAGDTGSVVLRDATGAVVLTIVVSNGPGWYNTTGELPATRAKYDLHFGGNTIGDLTVKNWSLYAIADVGPNAGELAQSIGEITPAATGEVAHVGELSQSIGDVSVSADGDVEVHGDASNSIGTITPSATGTVENNAPAFAGAVSGGTTNGSAPTVATTPGSGELILVWVAVSDYDEATEGVTDNNADGNGTYEQVWNASVSALNLHIFIYAREALIGSATSTTFTANFTANTAAVIGVIRYSGIQRVGAAAIRQSWDALSSSSSTAAVTFPGVCLTANPTIIGIASADITTTPPTNWTERIDNFQGTPTTALEVATRDSGFTGATITYGSSTSTGWVAVAIELDASPP